jgi:immunity protein 26 of polymorphic toxin system/regulator of ribonuclease activity B
MVHEDLPYQEGDWFLIPLGDGTYAVGLAARVNGDGLVLGYFFGPPRQTPPRLEDLATLTSKDAIKVGFFGDLSLFRGDWPVLGHLATWDQTPWPVPAFGRHNEFTNESWRVEYEDGSFDAPAREEVISFEECALLPRDVVSGAGAIEVVLADLLGVVPGPRLAKFFEEDGTRFFLYFSTEEASWKAHGDLSKRGYDVEVSFQQHRQKWLVVASEKRPFSQPELLSTDKLMKEVAAAFEGEYDGYDRPVTDG